MFTQNELTKIHSAAKIIEEDGVEGINTAAASVGPAIAMAMLIMHVRRNLGSASTFPARAGIVEETNELLEKERLLPMAIVAAA